MCLKTYRTKSVLFKSASFPCDLTVESTKSISDGGSLSKHCRNLSKNLVVMPNKPSSLNSFLPKSIVYILCSWIEIEVDNIIVKWWYGMLWFWLFICCFRWRNVNLKSKLFCVTNGRFWSPFCAWHVTPICEYYCRKESDPEKNRRSLFLIIQ